jgi:hypothetical protein
VTNSDPFDFSEYRPDLTQDHIPADGPSTTDMFGTASPGVDSLRDSASPYGAPYPSEDPYGTSPSASPAGASVSTQQGLAHPPRIWLLAGVSTATTGIALAALIRPAGPDDVLAWALAGPTAIVLLGIHTQRDLGERAKLYYSASPAITWLYRAALVLATVGIVANAWRIADWIGHR